MKFRRQQQPAPHFAQQEQTRADGLAARIVEIARQPQSASYAQLPHYRAAYRDASGNAAAHSPQPGGTP